MFFFKTPNIKIVCITCPLLLMHATGINDILNH